MHLRSGKMDPKRNSWSAVPGDKVNRPGTRSAMALGNKLVKVNLDLKTGEAAKSYGSRNFMVLPQLFFCASLAFFLFLVLVLLHCFMFLKVQQVKVHKIWIRSRNDQKSGWNLLTRVQQFPQTTAIRPPLSVLNAVMRSLAKEMRDIWNTLLSQTQTNKHCVIPQICSI